MDSKTLVLAYLEKVLEANESINLTRIDSWDQALVLHVEDSLSALPEVEQAPPGLYGDLGTGGGFPGVPIALYSGRDAVLVDSVKKKVAVIERILAEVCPDVNIKTYGGRIEELSKEMPNAFSVLTARALSQLVSLVELASPLLVKNGLLVCYKAVVSEDELLKAQVAARKVGMKLVSRRHLVLSDGETSREIVVFEKTGHPPIKLPRNVGMAQRKPLA